MIEKIDRNFLAEKVVKLETHSYSPEQNKLHFEKFKIATPGCVTLESAIDKILADKVILDNVCYKFFGLEYVKYKVLNGILLTENDIQDFIHEDFFPEVDKHEGENRRWSRWVTVVKQVGDKFFEVGYDKGLTEYQEDMYTEQPYEVFKTERVVTKTVTEYVKKKPDETIHE